jgi:hypothetical protein
MVATNYSTYPDVASVDLRAGELSHGLLGVVSVLHGDEGEALGAALVL